ncbi:MAG: hypothetical protein CM1200mP40_26070 [Gammaproteobacteria bacterium]|nr:MAG: hypothetical protein CM1200mP40_26070 [Gammaproteobacteria bacterium]
MSSNFAKFVLLEDIHFISTQIQRFYLQLVSEIDFSLQSLRNMGATPDLISEEFIRIDGE